MIAEAENIVIFFKEGVVIKDIEHPSYHFCDFTRTFLLTSAGSLIEDFDEAFLVQISPVVYLVLLVEGLDFLFEVIFSRGIDELFFAITHIRSIENEDNLALSSSVRNCEF